MLTPTTNIISTAMGLMIFLASRILTCIAIPRLLTVTLIIPICITVIRIR